MKTPSFLCGFVLVLVSLQGLAQDAEELTEEEAAAGVEEIIVTGSRLKRRDFSAPSPIMTIDRDTFDFSGQGTLETVFNQMPQFMPDFDRTANNPGNGTAQLNLRGLGSHRTLVMLNGRRLAPSGIGTAVDVNNLPQALIDRAEVITGGASTVYGSDAISGVVNFMIRDDFDGLSLDTSAYVTEEGDSYIYDISAAYGHNFRNGRGNITLFGGYYDREETYADAREFTSAPIFDFWWSDELITGGSARAPEGVLNNPQVDWGNGPQWTIFDSNGDPREMILPDDTYNWAPWNFLQIPLERYNGGFLLNYELSARSELYMEASYSESTVEQVLAPIPAGEWLMINTDNPILSPATQQFFADNLYPVSGNIVIGNFFKRFEELGPRIFENNSEYLRIVSGVKGEFASDWEYDVWFTYTENDEVELTINTASASRLQQGLLVDPVTGQCFDPSNGCVPVNIFGLGNMSPEAIDFIRLQPLQNLTKREQVLASAFVRGEIFETWAGTVDAAFGVEWRKDDGSFQADDFLFTGDAMGVNYASTVSGEESVYEAFAEFLVPLAEDAAFAQYLGLEVGGRYSKYDNAGGVETWKVGVEWRPVNSVGVRSMYQRSVRAPNLWEAFEEQSEADGFFVFSDPAEDPCSAAADPVASGNVDKCIATGLPADQIGVFDAYQFPMTWIWGGNPDLEPEVADTLTVGLVITPKSIPNLQLSIDYYDLEVEGEIGGLSAVDACFDSANVNNLFCDLIKRDPVSFNVIEVRQYNINRGLRATSGIDTQLSYRAELPGALAIGNTGADFGVNLIWTHVFELKYQQTLFSTALDCIGTYGWPCTFRNDGMTFPTDRVTTSLSYASGNLSAHLSWRWISGSDNGAPLRAADFGFPDPILVIPRIERKNYVDLGLAWEFNEHVTARLTIANLGDSGPPLMADAVWDKNTDTRMYDIFGRSYTLAFSLNY
ncbi:MAG: TonB-dependent receptor [Woeseiaceae bacterium]|nr:TonB-dependent receptor [Woeseiaceae bacterium]